MASKNEIFKKRREKQRKRAELEREYPDADINQKRTKAVKSTREAILKRRAKESELEKLGSDLAKTGQGDYRYVRGRIDDIYENAYDQVSDKMIMNRLEISPKEFSDMSENQIENVKSRMAWRIAEQNPEFQFMRKTKQGLDEITAPMADRRDKLILDQSRNQGIQMSGEPVDDKFVKWKRDELGASRDSVRKRFQKEFYLAEKGFAPELQRVETDKNTYLVADKMDEYHEVPSLERDELRRKIYRETPFEPEDMHSGNVSYNPKTRKPVVIDAGEFEYKSLIDNNYQHMSDADADFKDALKKRARKSIISKDTAGSLRRKLPVIGPIIALGSYLYADSAQAKTEVLEDTFDPAGFMGGAERVGGDLPKDELIKRSNFNRAMKLRLQHEVMENESRTESTDNAPI